MAVKDAAGVPRPGMFEKIKLFESGTATPVSGSGGRTTFAVHPDPAPPAPPPAPEGAPPPPPDGAPPPPPPPGGPTHVSARTANPAVIDAKASMAKFDNNPDAGGLIATKLFLRGRGRG